MKRYFLITVIFLSFNSCLMQCDYSQRELNNYFSISWVDIPNQQGISFSENPNSSGRSVIIGCYVYAVGNNENFIIVKQHPSNNMFCDKPDLNITNYYIIENANLNDNQDYFLHGPLESFQFDSAVKSLNIDDLAFSTVFPDNPDNYRGMSDY